MSEFDYQKQAQDYYSKAPVIILGSGASAAYGIPGMGMLADHLIANTCLDALPARENEAWENFCHEIRDGTDLEAALHKVSMSEALTGRIVKATWSLINMYDQKAFLESLQDNSFFPLGRLLGHMFKSSLTKINIVTTNYDRLVEYACDHEQLYHYTGFSHGFLRHLALSTDVTVRRRVNIWKVHGSLDWFQTPTENIVSISNTNDVPEGFEPQIVTPGTQKYQRTHLEPFRSIIHNADQSIVNANAYLCIGYGFNDVHIQPNLVEKCRQQNTPIIIITHSLSQNARRLILDGNTPHYLAIERGENDGESVVYSSLLESRITIDRNIWSLDGFLSIIM